MTRNPDNPLGASINLLDAYGFTSTVAVNSELEFARPLRLGDVVHHTLALEDVSEEKQTGLGTGHFVTSRITYLVGDDVVGSVLFRVLKFRPGTGAGPVVPTAEVAPRARHPIPTPRAGPGRRSTATTSTSGRAPAATSCASRRAIAAARSTSRRRRAAGAAAASTWASRSPPGAPRSTPSPSRITRRPRLPLPAHRRPGRARGGHPARLQHRGLLPRPAPDRDAARAVLARQPPRGGRRAPTTRAGRSRSRSSARRGRRGARPR